jgi:hypothetical protein
MAKMRAARYYGKEDVRVKDDVEVPTCGEGQIKVAPAFVGICGTGTRPTKEPQDGVVVHAPPSVNSASLADCSISIFSDLHEYLAGPQ